MNASEIASFIWSIAELLRGDYKQSEYGKVILPFTVLRRLDCVLEPTKAAVLAEFEAQKDSGLPVEHFLLEKSGHSFFNSSPMDMGKLLGDPANLRANLLSYVSGFSENVRDIFEKFEFDVQVQKLDSANLLFLVAQKFAAVDLHPNNVSNAAMGHMFEELIRKFAELSNETAGEHFTPREVIRLMVNLLFINDGGGLTTQGAVRTLYDPTAGTGGMLSIGEEHLLSMNPNASLAMHGQELNPESYAICKADMLVKGQDVGNIVLGNTLSHDGHANKKFDYMLSNPPFGVDWKKVEDAVRKEHEKSGYGGRFGPGLPRINEGSLLFLLHLVSKMRDPSVGGSRIGIVLSGSPLFNGAAGSGESEIRKYFLENDLVEAIIALPTDLFYNANLGTYIWILSNNKSVERKGKVQLVDGSSFWVKMRKTLGDKRKELSTQDIADITTLYGDFAEKNLTTVFDSAGKEISQVITRIGEALPVAPPDGRVDVLPVSKIFAATDFGYTTITVERPLKLRFESTEASFAKLAEAIGAKKAPAAEDAEGVRTILKWMAGKPAMFTRKAAEKSVVEACNTQEITLTAWMGKMLWACIEHRDPNGEVQMKGKGKPEPDSELRDTENIPLGQDIDEFFRIEVLPHAEDAWIDHSKSKIGYEISFSKCFHVLSPLRPLLEIDLDLKLSSEKIVDMVNESVSERFQAYPSYKSSAAPWFNKIPTAWTVDRIKASILRCKNGIWGDEAQGGDGDISCVRVADFDRESLVAKAEIPTIRFVTNKERQGRILQKGNLLLEKSGGGENQPVGFVVLYGQDSPAVCSNFVARMQLSEGMVPSFWRYFHAAAYSVRLNVGSINQTSGIQNLDQDRYFNERAPFPPQDEQEAIARFLDTETQRIDKLIEEQRNQIELLRERRAALIAEAVTGKIDVRGFVAPQQ